MYKKNKIPVHSMGDTFSGLHLSPLKTEKPAAAEYERSMPHRHDFYYCVLLDEGEMELQVDFEKVQIHPQSLYLSYPGQLHRVITTSAQRGWYLAFDASMLDEQLKDVLDQCLSEIMLVPLSGKQPAAFFSMIRQLYDVYTATELVFRKPVMRAMLTSFIYQLASAYLSVERLKLKSQTVRSIEITKNFRQLLRRNFKSMKRPAAYAAKLNITLSHLNNTISTVTGYSVTDYIQQETMLEAQRLLCHSSLTVKEIAAKLGYDDPQYFNRLFRKVTGTAPGAFRKNADCPVSAAYSLYR